MRTRRSLVVITVALGSAIGCRRGRVAREALVQHAPNVSWDTLEVRLRLNGDAAVDHAFLGHAGGRVLVGVVLGDLLTVDTIGLGSQGRNRRPFAVSPLRSGLRS